MFDRILVPTDGSARADEAIAVARQMAERDGSRLVLLRVEAERESVAEVMAANAAIEARVSELRGQGINAEARFEYGQAESGIPASALREGATLILMAPHHRNLLQALIHPSVTRRVIAHAPMPVLVWPEGLPATVYADLLAAPNSAVIVPLDGSEEAECALPLAVAYAKQYDRLLLVVRALVPPPLIGIADAYMLEAESQEREEREARAYLSALRKRLAREQGIAVQTMLVSGDAGDEIARVAEAHEGSLIVMSTHGRGGIARVFPTGVVAKLMQDAPVPLMITPPQIEAPVTVEEPVVVEADVIAPMPSASVASAT
jgi:nucleotide-binding universal stress UspA family protein